jgi:glycosyltransferase involved in cell wall biosynthesis
VVLASRVFEPEGSAAAYRLGALVRSLENAGYLVTVLTTRSPFESRSTRRVRRWPVLRDATGSVRGYLQYASFDIPLFFRLLFCPRADVVIAEPPPTTGVVTRIVCWLRRTPYVYFSADVSSRAAAGIGSPRPVVAIVTTLERWALRGASAVLAISEDVKDEVAALGADPHRVTVVGTGIDTIQFSVAGPTQDVDYPYFVYPGTMSEIQGAGVFIEAFARISASHRTVRLKMFGSGVEVEELARLARASSDRIDLSGTLEGPELATWIRGAVAGLASVRPERGYDFAFATKALVSISCGVPVIYAGVGPLNALIAENALGWSVDWDPSLVADAMAAALESGSPVSRNRLAEWVESTFSLTAVADRATSVVDAVLSERSTKRSGKYT